MRVARGAGGSPGRAGAGDGRDECAKPHLERLWRGEIGPDDPETLPAGQLAHPVLTSLLRNHDVSGALPRAEILLVLHQAVELDPETTVWICEVQACDQAATIEDLQLHLGYPDPRFPEEQRGPGLADRLDPRVGQLEHDPCVE